MLSLKNPLNQFSFLSDSLLIQVLSGLNDHDLKSSSLVSKLFHQLVMMRKENPKEIISNRVNYIENFLLNKVPGLNISYSHVFKVFFEKGIDIYISGGLIRDLLSMRSQKILDVDFSFSGDVETIEEIARDNRWLFSKRPDFPVIQIGDRKSCCLQGISADYTLNAPIESLEFCLNSMIYHVNTKKLIDREDKGCDAIYKRILNATLDDKEKWLMGESFGSCYNKIFRAWKMVGRGFMLEPSLNTFLSSKTKMYVEQDKKQFVQDMAFYLGRDYGDYESYKTGCALLMGRNWVNQVTVPAEGEIVSCYNAKELLWDQYTFCSK